MSPAEQRKTYAEESIKQIHRENRANILVVTWFLTLIIPEVINTPVSLVRWHGLCHSDKFPFLQNCIQIGSVSEDPEYAEN